MARRAPTGLEPDLSVHGPPTAREPRATRARWWTGWALLAIVVVAALLQGWLSLRPGLWVDELFSLAVATGHSVEHPAADARPALGDFVDQPRPVPAAAIAAYATHDRPPAPAGRVVRAVFLSDTSPPLYYVLLSAWTRLAGTSDAALRLFSTACALLCLPLLFLVGREIGGRATGLIACALFAAAPPVLYFASEGRMYALTWLWTLALAWLALRLVRDDAAGGARWPTLVAWAVAGAAGLLTHYFFAFVWGAVLLWLLLHPGPLRRARLAAAAALTGLLVLPWYARVPESLGRWRVTGGWLDGELTTRQIVEGPLRLLRYMVFWGASYRDKGEILAIALAVLLVAAMLRRGPRRWVTGRPQLLWLWVLAAGIGPLVFDLLLGTTSSQIGRYGLTGVPAALLLVAVGTGALPPAARLVWVALFVVSSWPGLRDVFVRPARPFHPFAQMGRRIEAWHRAAPRDSSDLVLVHSIPTGTIGVARHLRAGPPMTSWTVRLRERTPAELDGLLAGRCRVALVKVHDLLDPAPAEAWLRARSSLEVRDRLGRAEILYFTLRPPPGASADDCRAGGADPTRPSTSQSPTRSTGT